VKQVRVRSAVQALLAAGVLTVAAEQNAAATAGTDKQQEAFPNYIVSKL
jgi:hypothetical protein